MTCYNDVRGIVSPNQWEDSPARAFDFSLLYARPNSKTRTKTKKREEKERESERKEEASEGVHLTASEWEKLWRRYGMKNAKQAADKLSAYKLASGRRYKSDYAAILNWVMREVLAGKGVPEPVKASECPECRVKGGSHGAFCSVGNGVAG